ncbi:helix-turn-helix transcriptional regulator [Gracilibacillus saliphilus]|uniref:helix-turn-helix transcriptional regulator n=1 Tax=Gracilibacillus saliphilus TaxID=543890 RepID=UPI0013D5A1F9|nr:helix-turn-helix transcriptional regulator [Gracilibacillus saliphilus]
MSVKTGNFLRGTRMVAGKTQSEMARIFKVNRSTISRIENGDIEMKIDDFWEWVRYTKTPQTQEMLINFLISAQVISDTMINMPGVVSFILPFVA